MVERPASTATRSRRWSAALVTGAAILLAGCSAGTGDQPADTSSAVATTSSPSPRASASAAAAELPDSCAAMLALTELDAALGAGLPGTVSFVLGEPLPDIGRTGRITCGFGVTAAPTAAPTAGPSAAPTAGPSGVSVPPLLEISISSYTDVAAAADRIDVTRADRQTAGDQVQPVEVAELAGVALTGVTATTLVVADGTWTYSLTLQRAVVPDEETVPRLVAVALAVRAGVATR